ncbi:MAG: Re/Si-specific NAD(P)(+) transhydrogenase subunit alpha [Planctomycetota bacterium]|jgi:NAD(P) transhydrogenase subunit alpha|nr:Re/Si-specific NAD(P)(+) transhydrogenase subunit alpha [Planctomycetota bacterium]
MILESGDVMRVGVVKELLPGEARVAMIPKCVETLIKAGLQVSIEHGAGTAAGYTDDAFQSAGATIVPNRAAVYNSDIILQVRGCGAQKEYADIDRSLLRSGQVLIATLDPLGEPHTIAQYAPSGASIFSLELIPRITRAQSMDVLSSQATIAGYRAVLLAATVLPKMFPMMMTAAGTLSAAKVFVIGVGVAGLQAIASAKKLGAIVSAYDVRPACREQVESLGGKFVELQLGSTGAEDTGGYAKAMDENFYHKQRELLTSVVRQSDVVITTAAIPGKKSPTLVTGAAVESMAPGSVIVDLGAERGGNCELTQANQSIIKYGVTILGPTNLPAEVPFHASQMFANNITKFLLNMVKKGVLEINTEDEIVRETLLAQGGQVVNSRIISLLAPAEK